MEYQTLISLSGEVEDINGREFTLRTDHQEITMDTKAMERNPFDSVGHQQLSPSDRIHVIGWLSEDLFDGLQIEAKNVVTLETLDI